MLATRSSHRNPAVLAAPMLLGAVSACTVRPPAPASQNAMQCLAQLTSQGVTFQMVALPIADSGCGVDNAVRVEQTAIAWNRTAVMSCGLAAQLDSFEREA